MHFKKVYFTTTIHHNVGNFYSRRPQEVRRSNFHYWNRSKENSADEECHLKFCCCIQKRSQEQPCWIFGWFIRFQIPKLLSAPRVIVCSCLYLCSCLFVFYYCVYYLCISCVCLSVSLVCFFLLVFVLIFLFFLMFVSVFVSSIGPKMSWDKSFYIPKGATLSGSLNVDSE